VDRLAPIGCIADHLQVRLDLQQRPQPVSNHGVIVG
jgi:hypothetical protein